MNLLDSLLDTIVRLQGDALVMHVGEKPYVVTTTSAMNERRGPILWGQVELSSRVLTPEAVLGMLGQILPIDRRRALDEFGAVEHEIQASHTNDRFTVIAARGGDDVWIELRPRPKEVPVAVAVEEPVAVAVEEPVAERDAAMSQETAAAPVEIAAAPVQTAATEEQEIVAPQEIAAIDEPVEQPAELPAEPHVETPVEAPVYFAETADAIEEPEIVELPAALETEVEQQAGFDEPVVAGDPDVAAEPDDEEAAETPFEIVPEVNQDAPTDADVDALLAASAAALLAAPALSDPFDIDAIEPPAHDECLEPIAIAPELESGWAMVVARTEPEVGEIEPAPEPIPVSAETDPDHDAIAPEPELIPAIAEPEPIAIVPELKPEPIPFFAQMESEPFDIELESEPEFIPVFDEIEPEPVVVAPEPELVAISAEAESEAVGIRWEPQPVSMIADAELEHAGVRWEPEAVPSSAMADAESGAIEWEPELFIAESELEPVTIAPEPARAAVIEESEPEPVAMALEPEPAVFVAETEPELVAVAAEPEPVPEPVAPAPEPEPVFVIAETAPQPVGFEPEPVAVALEPEPLHADLPQPLPKPDAPDSPPLHVHDEPPVMASEPSLEPERAVIVPLARRPVRHEPASPGGGHLPSEFSIDELLRVAAARGASTVYLVAQSRPMVRAEGDISVLDIGPGTALEESDIARLMLDLAPATAREAWQRGTSAEWICDVAGVGRVRCMTFRDHRGPGLIFRMIPPQAISADQLGLTAEVQALCAQSDGLILVTGPRASGKSTLMSAFVDLINRTRSDHLITIESQIGFVHESRRSFVSQREVRGNGESVVAAVRSALREDPDVLFINDLSSAEMASVALDAAESGRLVFASLPAASTVAAVDRLLELLPENRRSHARASLAGSLRGVVAQVLVRRFRGGRSAAREVLLNTAAVAGLIQEAKTAQLTLAMESGRRHGMMPLNDALVAFVREGTVHVTEAYRKAFDKESLLAALRREGVDTSFAEKLA